MFATVTLGLLSLYTASIVSYGLYQSGCGQPAENKLTEENSLLASWSIVRGNKRVCCNVYALYHKLDHGPLQTGAQAVVNVEWDVHWDSRPFPLLSRTETQGGVLHI